MVNPHPKENRILHCDDELSMLAYFAARCPLPYTALSPLDGSLRIDCKLRIEWARTMLHTLWPMPVPAQNSQGGVQ